MYGDQERNATVFLYRQRARPSGNKELLELFFLRSTTVARSDSEGKHVVHNVTFLPHISLESGVAELPHLQFFKAEKTPCTTRLSLARRQQTAR
jgi:hypothetical protein